MKIYKTAIEGALLIELEVYEDARGFFVESYQSSRYRQHGIECNFVQDNRSYSNKGVLRGLHYQIDRPVGHLIYVTVGRIFDVGVDLRKKSPTFGRHVTFELSSERHQQLFLPPGIAHGFCALSDRNEIWYKCTDYYCPEDEAGLLWSDPDIGICWPIDVKTINLRDSSFPQLKQINDLMLPKIKE